MKAAYYAGRLATRGLRDPLPTSRMPAQFARPRTIWAYASVVGATAVATLTSCATSLAGCTGSSVRRASGWRSSAAPSGHVVRTAMPRAGL